MRPFRTLATAAAAAISLTVAGADAASAPGQVRICTSDLTNFDDMPSLLIPAGMIFTAWGRAAGDLRTLRLDPNYPPARTTGESAVVTTAEAQLSADQPCALTPARTLVSPTRAWQDRPLSPADGTVYQAIDTLGPNGVRSLGEEALSLASLLSMNILVASPAGPIDDPEMIP